MDKVIKNKRGLELVTSRSSGHKTKSEKFLYSLYIIWPSLMMWFLSFSKNYICKFMYLSSWHHILFHFHLTFWIWNLWKGRGKTQKLKNLKNEKSFLDEIKNIFHSFVKIIKLADTSFKVLKEHYSNTKIIYFCALMWVGSQISTAV